MKLNIFCKWLKLNIRNRLCNSSIDLSEAPVTFRSYIVLFILTKNCSDQSEVIPFAGLNRLHVFRPGWIWSGVNANTNTLQTCLASLGCALDFGTTHAHKSTVEKSKWRALGIHWKVYVISVYTAVSCKHAENFNFYLSFTSFCSHVNGGTGPISSK